ncbi:glycosyl hydrolase [Colletotrichum truncatum]|uniref:Glycosyl hydrolase n=1 Tax=Colletotrichum truncatum TaxID=5467 RepID=A0ACC3YKX4_COLTU|nr:glycosyl hydrolase [Colletotrichum truncatum]KAF6782858.1 glycosyl hydrolase [Colletotrichum truncatum]
MATADLQTPHQPFRVLVFSKSTGYRHDCIPTAVSAVRALGVRTGSFDVDATEDAEAAITADSLSRYKTIVFLHNTGIDFLNKDQMSALKAYIRGGGGFVGVHAASSGMKSDEWYGKLVGAYFDFHPAPEEGTVVVEDAKHYITAAGETDACACTERTWMDEWYNFTSHPRRNGNLHILARGDPSTFAGGVMGDDHPLAWCQEFEGGRSFYTALGHFDEAYADEWFMGQILRAIYWTARVNKGSFSGHDSVVGSESK